jgi:hypothetical protein
MRKVRVLSAPDHAQSHLALLALARQIRDAARSRDVDQVHTILCQLQNALMAHVNAECADIERLTSPARVVLLDGQSQLLRRIDRLLFESVETGDGCTCVGEALGLSRQLARQARLELRLGVATSATIHFEGD